MINLIKNELTKIFSKKSIYIVLIITLLFMVFTNVIYKYKLDESGNIKDNKYSNLYVNDYIDTATHLYNSSKENIDNNKELSKYEYYQNKKVMEENKYIIDNKINANKINDTRGILINLFIEYELFLIILIIMISGVIISEEFNKGTIKKLLLKPYKRWQILLSKYITSIIVMILGILFLIFMEIIIGSIFFGLSSLSVPVLIYNFNINRVVEYNIFYYLLIIVLAKIPMLILLITFIFLISIITLNSAVSIIFGLMIYITYPIINNIFLNMNVKILKYFITPNWDFTNYLFGMISKSEYIKELSSIIICLTYFIISLIITFFIFKKRNIKNV